VRQAFERVGTSLKLALVGDAPYAHDYIRRVRDTGIHASSCPAPSMAGLHQLGSHSFAYIHATEVAAPTRR